MRLEPEVGDLVTVQLRHHGKPETFRDVSITSVPAPDRFTFFVTGRLFEATPDDILAFRGRAIPTLGAAMVLPEHAWPRR